MSDCHYTPMTEFQREQYRHAIWHHLGADPIGLIDRAVARGWAKRPVFPKATAIAAYADDMALPKEERVPHRKWLGVKRADLPTTPLPAHLANVDPGSNLNDKVLAVAP